MSIRVGPSQKPFGSPSTSMPRPSTTTVEDYPTAQGRRAFGPAARVVLSLLRRHEFRLLRVEPRDEPQAPATGAEASAG